MLPSRQSHLRLSAHPPPCSGADYTGARQYHCPSLNSLRLAAFIAAGFAGVPLRAGSIGVVPYTPEPVAIGAVGGFVLAKFGEVSVAANLVVVVVLDRAHHSVPWVCAGTGASASRAWWYRSRPFAVRRHMLPPGSIPRSQANALSRASRSTGTSSMSPAASACSSKSTVRRCLSTSQAAFHSAGKSSVMNGSLTCLPPRRAWGHRLGRGLQCVPQRQAPRRQNLPRSHIPSPPSPQLR